MERFSVAEIAQLVEHNLAKVGVASSSLVFRSKSKFDFSVLRRRYRPISGIFFCFQKVEQESGLSIFLYSMLSGFQIVFSAFGGCLANCRQTPRELSFVELPSNVIPGKDQESYVHVIANVRKDSIAGK